MGFPFLHLPPEMQRGIIRFISGRTDLKSLRLVSKQVSALAVQELYRHLDLESGEAYKTNEEDFPQLQDRLLARVNSLLLCDRKNDNLLYVRNITTDHCDLRVTKALDALLPRLRDDFLIRFRHRNYGADHFPTAQQMEFIWSHQRNLQNLRSTYIVPTLVNLLARKQMPPSRFLRSVTHAELIEAPGEEYNPLSIQWPLENLDLSRLTLLVLVGWSRPTNFARLNSMFSNQLLPNLERLAFVDVTFSIPVQLINCPSLWHLALHSRGNAAPDPAGLVIPHKIPIKNFFWVEVPVDHLVHALTQIQGLENLFVRTRTRSQRRMKGRKCKRLAAAIELHQKTLRSLVLDDSLLRNEDGLLNVSFLESVKKCTRLRRLALPLGEKHPIWEYKSLIESLPRLSALVIFDPFRCNSDDTPALADALMEATSSSRLSFLAFCDFENYHPRNKISRPSQCFSRRKAGMQAECEDGAEMSAVPIRPGGSDAVSIFDAF